MAMAEIMSRHSELCKPVHDPNPWHRTHHVNFRNDKPAPGTRVKARGPDPYDGSDPAKLRTFLSQCKLAFRAQPDNFEDDEVNITYAVSWPKGTAQRRYEPNLSLDDRDLPQFARHWDTFDETLKNTFSEPDPINTAIHKLDNLRMRDHHYSTKFNVTFNEYSAITGFEGRYLYAEYYKGLAARIKGGLVYSGRPDTLAELRSLATNLDLHYWERKDEGKYLTTSNSGDQLYIPSSSLSSATSPSSSSSQSRSSHPEITI